MPRPYQSSFTVRFGLTLVSLLGAAFSAACSGSDTGTDTAGLGSASKQGKGGGTSTGSGGSTSVGSGGTGTVIMPPAVAGSSTMGTAGAPTGPTGLPSGFTKATIGGFKVGDPITTDAAQPTPTTDSGCGTTILAVIRDFEADGLNFENPAQTNKSTDDRGIVA